MITPVSVDILSNNNFCSCFDCCFSILVVGFTGSGNNQEEVEEGVDNADDDEVDEEDEEEEDEEEEEEDNKE